MGSMFGFLSVTECKGGPYISPGTGTGHSFSLEALQ